MILYHGTTLEIKEPKIFRNEIGRDFGFAFYTTERSRQRGGLFDGRRCFL